MTQLIYTANICNFNFHLTLRKSVTNGQRTDSTVYRVAAQLIISLCSLMKKETSICWSRPAALPRLAAPVLVTTQQAVVHTIHFHPLPGYHECLTAQPINLPPALNSRLAEFYTFCCRTGRQNSLFRTVFEDRWLDPAR